MHQRSVGAFVEIFDELQWKRKVYSVAFSVQKSAISRHSDSYTAVCQIGDSNLDLFLFYELLLHLMKASGSLTEILNFKQSDY